MSLADYEFITVLGNGAFADVVKVKSKKSGKIYALKKINISQLGKEEIEKELNEIRLLYSLNHPNIIGYKEAFYDETSGKLNIVLEFADDGDLLEKIKYNKEHQLIFHEETIWEIIIQMLLGVSYLHSSKIIHRDLKSANIFLMKNGQLKIGDLNVSKHMKTSQACTYVGTPIYLAPELWDNQYYDYKCDIWSLGCIIYELCTLKPPFMGSSFKQLKKAVTSGVYKNIPQNYSNDLKKLISWMIQIDPDKRKSAQELLDSNIIELRIKNNPNFVQYKGLKDRFLKASIIKTIVIPKSLKNINRVLPIKELQEKENENMKNLDKNKKNNFNNNIIKKIEVFKYNKEPVKKKKKKVKKIKNIKKIQKKISYDREEIPKTDRNDYYKDNPLREINYKIYKRGNTDNLCFNKNNNNYSNINSNNNISYNNNNNNNLNNGYSSGSNSIYNISNTNNNNNGNYNNFNNNNYNNNNRNFDNRNYGNNNINMNNNYNKNNINNSNYFNNSNMSTNISNFNNGNNNNYSRKSSLNTNNNSFNNSNIYKNSNYNIPINIQNSNMGNNNYNNNFNNNINYNNNSNNNNNMNYNNNSNNNNNMNYNNNSNYNNNYNNNIRNVNVNNNNYINNNFNNYNMNNRNMNMNMNNNMNNRHPNNYNINNSNNYNLNNNNIYENKAHMRPKSGRANMRNLNNYNNNMMKNEIYNNYNNYFNNNNIRNVIDDYPFNQRYNRNFSNKNRKY